MSEKDPFLHQDSEVDIKPSEFANNLKQDLADYFDDLLFYQMPFGRFKNSYLDELPYEYLHWFAEKGGGFPTARLGELMEFVYHTKSVGAEVVFSEVRKRRKHISG